MSDQILATMFTHAINNVVKNVAVQVAKSHVEAAAAGTTFYRAGGKNLLPASAQKEIRGGLQQVTGQSLLESAPQKLARQTKNIFVRQSAGAAVKQVAVATTRSAAAGAIIEGIVASAEVAGDTYTGQVELPDAAEYVGKRAAKGGVAAAAGTLAVAGLVAMTGPMAPIAAAAVGMAVSGAVMTALPEIPYPNRR